MQFCKYILNFASVKINSKNDVRCQVHCCNFFPNFGSCKTTIFPYTQTDALVCTYIWSEQYMRDQVTKTTSLANILICKTPPGAPTLQTHYGILFVLLVLCYLPFSLMVKLVLENTLHKSTTNFIPTF